MTESELRTKAAYTAKSFVGLRESDGGHRKIIDLYNSQKTLPVGYKVSYTDPWCATFVSAVGVFLNLSDVILPECSCPRMVALYQKAGRWMEDDAYVPDLGDILMYDWQDSGTGDNTGSPDHVGIVVGVNKDRGEITVVEGNKADSVSTRTIPVNARYIRGYCLPDYAGKAAAISNAVEAEKQEPQEAAQIDASRLSGEDCYEIVRKAQEYAATLPVSGWAVEKFAQAKDHGITDGTNPQTFVTREEAAIMADRARSVHQP